MIVFHQISKRYNSMFKFFLKENNDKDCMIATDKTESNMV